MRCIICFMMLATLIGCGSYHSLNKDSPVPATQSQQGILIRTRIVILHKNDMYPVNWYDINDHTRYTEDIFSFAGLKFDIQTLEYISLPVEDTEEEVINFVFNDALCYPNTLSIYYTDRSELFGGLGAFPDQFHNHGILIFGKVTGGVFAHEIGHTLGFLRHTFDPAEDIEDTSPIFNPLYKNLMNYPSSDYGVFITEGQKKRFLENIWKYRNDYVVLEEN